MNIIEKNINELKAYANNPRHNEKAVDAVAASIKEFGWKNPVVIDKDGVIAAGHTRVAAAKKLGIKTIPCIVADDLTEEQIRAFRLADNKTAELAEWDEDLLAEELEKIDSIDMTDFSFDAEMFREIEKEFEKENENGKENERERTFNAYRLEDIDFSRITSKWEMPIIKATQRIPKDLMSFNYALTRDDFDKGIHFFIDDYQFERMWSDPYNYVNRLKKFDCCLTPDFSLYQEMPLPEQIYNVFRSKLIGQIMQDAGIDVIPTLQWCRQESFEFAFEGLEPGGVYAVSTIGVKRSNKAKNLFDEGMKEAINILKPHHIVCYGGDIGYTFPCDVSYISNHNTERMKNAEF